MTTLGTPTCPLCSRTLVFDGTDLAGCAGSCDADRIRDELGWPRPSAAPRPQMRANGSAATGPAKVDELLDEVAGFVRRFVVMTGAQADVVALWTAHTHCFAAADTTPYVSVSSAEKRSGKTRLLEVLELLVARPWLTGRVTAAVLARKVDAEKPALLLDESDAAFKGAEDYVEALRGLLNTGHRLGGKVTVCVTTGGEISYRDFSTFCPKAIAGIGKLPDTVADRAIPIRLERRAPGEQAERFRHREAELDAFVLREHLEQLAGLVERLEAARPDLPDELNDRAQDAAEPLLAIADLAGGDWPARARRALVELHGGRAIEDESVGVRLLADLRTVFGEEDRLASTDLLDRLHGLEEAPWAEWYGKPLTARGLAKLLLPYGIRPHHDRKSRGYGRDALEDAWARYLPPNPSTRHESALGAGSSAISTRHADWKRDGSIPAGNPHGEPKRDGLTLTPPETRPQAVSATLDEEAEHDRVTAKFRGLTNER